MEDMHVIVYVSYYVLISTLEKTNPEQAPKDPCEGRVRCDSWSGKGTLRSSHLLSYLWMDKGSWQSDQLAPERKHVMGIKLAEATQVSVLV